MYIYIYYIYIYIYYIYYIYYILYIYIYIYIFETKCVLYFLDKFKATLKVLVTFRMLCAYVRIFMVFLLPVYRKEIQKVYKE